MRRASLHPKLVAYAQGMDLLTRAGKVRLGPEAGHHRIAVAPAASSRAELLGDIMAAYAGEAPANMLRHPPSRTSWRARSFLASRGG